MITRSLEPCCSTRGLRAPARRRRCRGTEALLMFTKKWSECSLENEHREHEKLSSLSKRAAPRGPGGGPHYNVFPGGYSGETVQKLRSFQLESFESSPSSFCSRMPSSYFPFLHRHTSINAILENLGKQ